jgi:UDP-glucose 4-epimerase
MTKNILITGGAGNVGSSLAKKLVENSEYKVYVFDNLITGSLQKIPNSSNVEFIKGDVNNFDEIYSLMNKISFDFVFHYAALVGVKRTIENPLLVLKDIEGIRNILDLSVKNKVKRIFYSSSSEVYGEPVESPQREETTPLNARLPYAIVKNVGEAYLKSYYKEYGLEFGVFRFFNTYGPNQSNDFVVSKFIDLALKDLDITIYGDGKQTRTFCFIDDNIDTTIKIMEEKLFVNSILNIGSDTEISVLDLANLIMNKLKIEGDIIPIENFVGSVSRRLPDTTLLNNYISYKETELKSGIEKYVDWYKKNINSK